MTECGKAMIRMMVDKLKKANSIDDSDYEEAMEMMRPGRDRCEGLKFSDVPPAGLEDQQPPKTAA